MDATLLVTNRLITSEHVCERYFAHPGTLIAQLCFLFLSSFCIQQLLTTSQHNQPSNKISTMTKKSKESADSMPAVDSGNGTCNGPPLRLAVFDLDFTIWRPEMYQLNGAPKLTEIDSKNNRKLSAKILEEARTIKTGHILTDRSHSPMRVFPGA